MTTESTPEQVDYDTDEDLYPPDQASDLGASYYYCTPGPGHSVYDAQRPGTSRPGRVFFPSRGAS